MLNIDNELLEVYKTAETELHDFFSNNFTRICSFCAFVTAHVKDSNEFIQTKYWCCCTGSKVWPGWQLELAMLEYGEDFEEWFRETAINNACIAQCDGCPLKVGRPFECNKLICHHQFSIAKKIDAGNPHILTDIIDAYESLNNGMTSSKDEVEYSYALMQKHIAQYIPSDITNELLLQEDATGFIQDCLLDFCTKE